ncbi:hypothetical protein AALF15_01275 [Corynebacteriaceae bacterium 7-707]
MAIRVRESEKVGDGPETLVYPEGDTFEVDDHGYLFVFNKDSRSIASHARGRWDWVIYSGDDDDVEV